MLFNSTIFVLVFLPLTLLAYYLVAGSRRLRLAVLCFASLVFYAYWDIRFVPLLAVSASANWLLVKAFSARRAAILPAAGVALNLVVLGGFKYADFFAGSLLFLGGRSFDGFNIILPIGISFFTFQQISYLVDLRRGEKRIYGFLEYFLFVTFFPQLIAGPIVRHNEIITQYDIDPRGPEVWERLSRGFVLFLMGLIKKVVLADQLALIADPLFQKAADGAALGWAESWVADLAFTLQIYFDFSGYSDMAIGLGLMFGFVLPRNFAAPYRATSIREFWRRWHMTLSRFLRDYLYIPMGGNRHGRLLRASAVVATMLLGGLWHGAAWTFVAWGGLHGAALALNAEWRQLGAAIWAPIGWCLTILFVMLTWVLFRAPDFAAAGGMFSSMLGLNGRGSALPDGVWLLAAGSAVVLFGVQSHKIAFAEVRPRWWMAAGTATAFVFVLIMIGGAPQNEFIYFQF